ncbi:Arc-like DNA binding domain-containing protein [Peptoniphilus asaccharolyticus DSM 20463]|uniref:Regulatory protein n=3 Tax=Peptoniphilus TaxID=162289 RepID=G4D5K6_9FIRM|nr:MULTISPECIES: Arc family DNA-binding protein [Peptoniphilus]EGY78672.1 regulatory protein [Peptoniphilus indolicus ATCC 29427]MBL7575555.1 Arc family DNA-binding protein [Peptoniphilus asaccharolyticus]SMB87243.1 Arc-like DNA binding domain-containing protein [Peptoniphilus asaccharolyticus DSM 20463]SUB74425.1 Arc-like DNA binding domain [Peptoniphilus indolicus]
MDENITFTFRTTREVINKIKYIAESNGRSANKEIEQLVIQAIKTYEKENGEISE